jgi:hypothetical protein
MPDILLAYADCVAMLHEAALSPERWTDALKASARLFGASGVLLTDLDTQRRTPRAIHTWGQRRQVDLVRLVTALTQVADERE